MPDSVTAATAPLAADGFPASAWTPPNAPVPPAPAAVPQPAAAAAPASAAAFVPPPVVRDLSGRPLTSTRDLAWPKEVDGVAYRQVVMRRLSTGEVNAFVDKVRAAGTGAEVRFPLFYDVAGALLPDAVWDALDPDDTDALAEDGNAFLPARFRTGTTATASIPSAADTTGNMSAAPQATA